MESEAGLKFRFGTPLNGLIFMRIKTRLNQTPASSLVAHFQLICFDEVAGLMRDHKKCNDCKFMISAALPMRDK